MKKIDLITGFLGSGKTTFIKKYVKYLLNKGEKICILINDFGAVNVDMMLLNELRSENCELEMVSGGCDKDCHKRRFKTKLIAMGMDDYTRVIVEPSGIFDVDEFFDALYDEPICNWYEIGNVIAIVDAGISTTPLSLASRYMLASEVSCAGVILLSKTQGNSQEVISTTKELIQNSLDEINCDRDITDSFIDKEWGALTESDYDVISSASYKKASFIKKHYDDDDTYSSIYFLDKNFTIEKIRDIASKIFSNASYGNVMRIKGFTLENGAYSEINATKESFSVSPINEGQDVLIIIGENLNEAKVQEII